MPFILGLDVGGTGTKGAIVDTDNGILVSDRVKYATPKNATPEKLRPVIKNIISDLGYEGKRLGVGFPTNIQNNVCVTANNINKSWIGTNLQEYFAEISNLKTSVINDADAAGMAELHFGAAKDVKGTCILLTLGTGVGSAVYVNGAMLRNVELGSLEFNGDMAEKYVSNKIRKERELGWKAWGNLLNDYLLHVNKIFSPTRIILGGGVSKKFKEYKQYLTDQVEIVPAEMFNEAGIVGAAVNAKIKKATKLI